MADVSVVAVMTRDQSQLQERLEPLGGVPAGARVYTELHELLQDPEVDAVDVCLPTDQHHIAAMSAALAGKHILVECPAGRRSGSVRLLARTAKEAGVIAMPGMYTRFSPPYLWLKSVVAEERYGRLSVAHFRRLTPFPNTPFHRDSERSGGAILDLHLHDTDLVCHLLGMPVAVTTVGRSMVTTDIDYVITQYDYGGDAAPIVSSLASWAMADGFPPQESFVATFERPGGDRTSLRFEASAPDSLTVYREGRAEVIALTSPSQAVTPATTVTPSATRLASMPSVDPYQAMIRHFVDCVRDCREPDVSMDSSADAIAVIEAERSSALSGGRPQAVHGGRLSLMV